MDWVIYCSIASCFEVSGKQHLLPKRPIRVV